MPWANRERVNADQRQQEVYHPNDTDFGYRVGRYKLSVVLAVSQHIKKVSHYTGIKQSTRTSVIWLVRSLLFSGGPG
jgi:hypothetical protein